MKYKIGQEVWISVNDKQYDFLYSGPAKIIQEFDDYDYDNYNKYDYEVLIPLREEPVAIFKKEILYEI